MLALTQQVKLANLFLAYVLARYIRYQQDIVDQHCNLSEKRLARTLLLLAHFDGQESSETVLERTSHETLAEMVGTTRSRVCYFMKRFKDSGLIYYEFKSKLVEGLAQLRQVTAAADSPAEALQASGGGQ